MFLKKDGTKDKRQFGKGPPIKHGLRYHPIYAVWTALNARCKNPNNKDYRLYGGKGVGVAWRSFDEFVASMMDGYNDHVDLHGRRQTTLDRIDSKKDYSKVNCRWVTWKEQRRNMDDLIMVKIGKINLCLTDWAKKLEVPYGTLYARYKKHTWPKTSSN
jgi:hypothetical protein